MKKEFEGLINIKEFNKVSFDNIVYENEFFIVANKPVGVESQDSIGLRTDMPSILRGYLSTQNKRKDNYIGVIHRLDKGVSGLMIFSKDKKCSNELVELFSKKKVKKVYNAVVCGHLVDNSKILENNVVIDAKNKHIQNVDNVDNKSTYMKLKYEALKKNNIKINNKNIEVNLLNIELITGKYHQIRYQLYENKTPILGDRLYYNDESSLLREETGIKNIFLSCKMLEFNFRGKYYKFENDVFGQNEENLKLLGYSMADIEFIKKYIV